MTAGEIAALIAAVSFALLSLVGVFVLIRLARLISEGTAMLSDVRTRSDELLVQASQAVDRAHEQLTRTDAISTNLDVINSNLAELTGDISLMTRAVRTMFAGPVGRVAAFSYGVRRAIGLRRGGVRASTQRQVGDQDPRAALTAGR